MNLCALIIPTCLHILPSGHRCQQPALRHRACCRHHLDAQARLHNMARARRRTVILRLRVPETSRDLAWNKIELNRVLATERIDPEAALMMLWAMDLTAQTLRAESTSRPRRAQNRASNTNRIYDVPLNPLFPQSLSATLSQMIENTNNQGEGVHLPNWDSPVRKGDASIPPRRGLGIPPSQSLPGACLEYAWACGAPKETTITTEAQRSLRDLTIEALCPQCLRGESSRTDTELSSPNPTLTEAIGITYPCQSASSIYRCS